MTEKSHSLQRTTDLLLTNLRMLWYIRFPMTFMCLLIVLGPVGLILFARFLGTAIVANSILQIASLVFICFMATTIAMIQISFILQRGQDWLDDEHIKNTVIYRFFEQIQSREFQSDNRPRMNWLFLGWKWPLKPTLILLLVGFSLPFWCSLNGLLNRASPAMQKSFIDEPEASWRNTVSGLLLGFVLYLLAVQAMSILQTLFTAFLRSKSQMLGQTQNEPFMHHPVSPILTLRPILSINLKPLPNWLRDLLVPFIRVHHELIFWGASVILIYGFVFFQTLSQVIDSDHIYTAVFYLVLWLLLIEAIFAAIAFFFDRYRIPALLLVIVFFAVYQTWLPYDHRFATIPFDPHSASDPMDSTTKPRVRRSGSKNVKIIVVAPGGGIHASAWTGTVLAGLHERYGSDFEDSLHLISAVSGGSVGTMFYLDHFEFLVANNPSLDKSSKADDQSKKPDELKNSGRGSEFRKRKYEDGLAGIRRRSSTSSLESLFWGLTFPDTVRIFTPWWIMRDRGDVQESLFRYRLDLEGDDTGPTLLSWQKTALQGQMPFVVFNATEANTGQRVLFSTLPLPNKKESADMFDIGSSDWKPKNFLLLSGGTVDIPISTAVRLSATFPYISPASRPTVDSNIQLGHVVDGGYADNEGLITAIEEINRLNESSPDNKKNLSGNEEAPTIVLIRIAHQPRSDLLLPKESAEESQAGGLDYAAFGPLFAALNVRDSSQKERGEIELRLLKNRLNESINQVKSPKFHEVTLRFQSNGNIKIPPLNWKLLPNQRSAYQAAWDEILKDTCRTSNRNESVGEGLQILDELFPDKCKNGSSK